VWQADFRRLATRIRVAGQDVHPWMVLVASRSHDLVLAHEVLEEEPSAALLWDTLTRAMRTPKAGDPHRPTELQAHADERWESLRASLGEVGVPLVTAEHHDLVEEMLTHLSEHLGGASEPGLLDVPGVTPERAGSFYEAAAYFYQQAPWKKVGYESAIKI